MHESLVNGDNLSWRHGILYTVCMLSHFLIKVQVPFTCMCTVARYQIQDCDAKVLILIKLYRIKVVVLMLSTVSLTLKFGSDSRPTQTVAQRTVFTEKEQQWSSFLGLVRISDSTSLILGA